MDSDYKQIVKESRLKVLDLVYKAQTSHIGSLLSCADIMAVLFEKIDLDKDKFILSAGWKVCMLYYHLWRKGRITIEELESYCMPGSKFIGLAEPIIPDIPFAGGSMGYGFPAAVGYAMAKKLKREEGKIYCLMSDGELAIGTTWEAALIAAHHKLDNLVVVIDRNGFQAMGKTNEILSSYFPYNDWENWDIDGHDFSKIEDALNLIMPCWDCHGAKGKDVYTGLLGLSSWQECRSCYGNGFIKETSRMPKIIYANTIKGKGVSFMENENIFHYKQLSEQEYGQAKKELRQS